MEGMLKKIAFIIPRMDEGGMPRVLESLSNCLDNLYEQYSIVLMKDKEVNYSPKGEIINVCDEGKGIVGKLVTFYKRIKYVRDIKRKYCFDIVVGFGVASNIINIISRQREKIIITEHNVKSVEHKRWGLLGFIYNILIRNYYNKADAIVTVSSLIADDLHKRYNIDKKKLHVIYNGINIREIMKKSEEKCSEFESDSTYIITSGRCCYQKGQWHLIRIMPYLLKNNEKIKLIILGDGNHLKIYRKMIEDNGLNDAVILKGHVGNPFKYIKKAKLFLFPSLYEGFSMAFIEAMALGVPVIASDCLSGPREVLANITDYNTKITENKQLYGVLIPEDKSDEIFEISDLNKSELLYAEWVLKLLSDNALYDYYVDRSQKRAEEFTDKYMTEQYHELFLKILEEN